MSAVEERVPSSSWYTILILKWN